MYNLLKIRTEKKMNQVALAVKLGVAQETISAYENNKTYQSIETLLKLCDIFNVSSDFLLDRTDIDIPIDELSKELSANELELLSLFRKLSPANKERAIGIIMGLLES